MPFLLLLYIFMQLFSLLYSPFLLPCLKSWQKSTSFKIQIEKCPWLNTYENINLPSCRVAVTDNYEKKVLHVKYSS
jgi:hypothetical protein